MGCVTKEFHDLRLLELNGDPSSLNEFGGLYSMHSDATQSNEIKASLLVKSLRPFSHCSNKLYSLFWGSPTSLTRP